jgi:hypothetical protein
MLNGFMTDIVLTLGSAIAESSWSAELTAAVAGVGAVAAGTDAAVVPKQLPASSNSSSPGSIHVSLLLLLAMLQEATGS